MNREELVSRRDEAVAAFDISGTPATIQRYGKGHINDSFLLTTDSGSQYILQRINHFVFTKPDELMANLSGITSFMRDKIESNGGDHTRENLNLIKTKAGKDYYVDSLGSYWRIYDFIENSMSIEQIENKEQFYQSALAFGRFQCLLSDYPVETLYETIPNFHNTPVRLEAFKKILSEDGLGRASGVKREIDFVLNRVKDMNYITSRLEAGELPLRVTHNDTKLNNVLFDKDSELPLCVVDLDTVMAGSLLYDFGDSIRFGATTAEEDEPDLSKVNFDIDLFGAFSKGFLAGNGFTQPELAGLPYSAIVMTIECGMRFLGDYIDGDNYFRIHREGQNLDRARTQLKLVADMEASFEEMEILIKRYSSN